jgi:hypothetical protein
MTDTQERRPPTMMGNVALGKKIPGYHYAYSPDGALCIEIDVPAENMVTMTWQAGELAGKSSVIVCTKEVFEAAMRSYYVEFAAKKK